MTSARHEDTRAQTGFTMPHRHASSSLQFNRRLSSLFEFRRKAAATLLVATL